MRILFMLLVFIVLFSVIYALPVIIEQYALALGITPRTIPCLFVDLSESMEHFCLYNGKKNYIFKIFDKKYKVDAHHTVLKCVPFLNFFFYFWLFTGVIFFILGCFKILPSGFVIFYMVIGILLSILLYLFYAYYYQTIDKKIHSGELIKIVENVDSEKIVFTPYEITEERFLELQKKYSYKTEECLEKMIEAANSDTTYEGKKQKINDFGSMLKYQDERYFQNSLYTKFLQLFDYSIEPIEYHKNILKFYETYLKRVYKEGTKEDKKEYHKELVFFLYVIGYASGYEKEIYKLEQELLIDVSNQKSFDEVYTKSKKLNSLVTKQIQIFSYQKKMGITQARYETLEEYYKIFLNNATHNSYRALKIRSIINIASSTLLAIVLILLAVFKSFDFVSVIITFTVYCLVLFVTNILIGANDIPFFNLYVPLDKELFDKYNFLSKYLPVVKRTKEAAPKENLEEEIEEGKEESSKIETIEKDDSKSDSEEVVKEDA